MKHLFLYLFITCLAINAEAQSPQAFKYQTVVRSASGSVIADSLVSFRFSIIADSLSGANLYVETHHLTTSPLGLIQTNIGEGTVVSGSFANIDWGDHTFYLKTELDLSNSGNYQFMGISPLLSVPYALFAEHVVHADDDWIFADNNIYSGNSGYTGVGISNPMEKLHVGGNIKTEDTLLFKGYVNPGAGIDNPGQLLIGERDIKIGYRSDNFGNILIGNSLYGKSVFDIDMTGTGNIGMGTDIFHETTTGYSNVCIGMYSGYNLSTGNSNVFLGSSAGEHISLGALNVCLGNQSGNGRNGTRNIFLGNNAGYAWNGSGDDNVMLGSYAGYKSNATNNNCIFIGKSAGYDVNSNYNVFVGPFETGRSAVGEKNIFLGYQTGKNFVGNGYLLIDNKNDNLTPFIKGDMVNDQLEINGDLTVNGHSASESVSIQSALHLSELFEYPLSPEEGDLIYMNDTLRFYTGITWKKMW